MKILIWLTVQIKKYFSKLTCVLPPHSLTQSDSLTHSWSRRCIATSSIKRCGNKVQMKVEKAVNTTRWGWYIKVVHGWETGLLFCLKIFAYGSIFIVIGGWILKLLGGRNGMKWKWMKRIILKYFFLPLFGHSFRAFTWWMLN